MDTTILRCAFKGSEPGDIKEKKETKSFKHAYLLFIQNTFI